MIAEVKPELNDIVLAKWQNMLDFVANLFGVEISRITKVNNRSIDTILFNKGSRDKVIKQQKIGEGSFCDVVINKNAPLKVEEEKAYFGLPISWPDEEIFGTLVIEDTKRHTFSRRYHDIMSSFEKIMNTDLALLMESKNYDRRSTFSRSGESDIEMHHIRSGVVIFDESHIIKSFNDEAEVISGYMRDEVIGQTIQALNKTLGLGETVASGKLYEIENKNGYKKIILVDIGSMEGPNGGQLTVVSFTDQSHYLELQTKHVAEKSVDDATGVYNCRGISDLLNNEAKRASRYKHSLSIIGVRIDGYHMLNGVHGVGQSDIVLQTLAIILKNETRDVDLIGRLSEDVFMAVLPDTTLKAAKLVAKRIVKASINYSDDESPFTISVATKSVDQYKEIDWHEEVVAMIQQSEEG